MPQTRERIEQRLAAAGATPTSSQLEQLAAYLTLLERWNARMNLTALESPDAAVDRLIVEPVLASSAIDHDAKTLTDVGSGGGSPAIPLKVMRADLKLTMVEVKTRKSVFLREAVRHLALDVAHVETGRFEDVLGRSGAGELDVLSIRAVRAEDQELSQFAEALRPRGQLLWFVSGAQDRASLPDTLTLESERTLVPCLSSRLVVLRRR